MKMASKQHRIVSRPCHLFDEIRLNDVITDQASAPSRRPACYNLEPFLLKSERAIEKEMAKIFQKTGNLA